ncbi:hypothetical protein P153DRAFT_380268 [Dothidotthia symphoricarpi CBS 119687]|uniref:Uncharacterized protein n=1 Tax=Dothidotthia symphoricarpi CBS 119687 TaxID=1392245 RepID=A0A6A6AR42_9PLEO|nr:uncharacterized protein P153DRAFT_380268 [Dothidotthia symphoricarpi CBS 119687]KAF2134452.1 hypothetical protein P153DRAFT_380268 [Dothidotthia symphoricarpi CBS 119687]
MQLHTTDELPSAPLQVSSELPACKSEEAHMAKFHVVEPSQSRQQSRIPPEPLPFCSLLRGPSCFWRGLMHPCPAAPSHQQSSSCASATHPPCASQFGTLPPLAAWHSTLPVHAATNRPRPHIVASIGHHGEQALLQAAASAPRPPVHHANLGG